MQFDVCVCVCVCVCLCVHYVADEQRNQTSCSTTMERENDTEKRGII